MIERNEQRTGCVFFAAFILATGVGLAFPGRSLGQDRQEQSIRTRFLLLDSRIIDKTTGATLTLGEAIKSKHNPLFTEDKPWEPRFDNVYATVVFDSQDDLYKCFYNPFIVDQAVTSTPPDKRHPAHTSYMETEPRARELALCYATSPDGVNWEKPNLGLIEFEGSTANNMVLRSYSHEEQSDPHGCAVLLDDHETDPSKRWKINFQYAGGALGVSYSPDGLHWSTMKSTNITVNGTHNCVLWDEELNKYVTYSRRDENKERRIARTESSDFETWSHPEIVLKGPSMARQTHDLVVFYHGGVYIGLLGAMIGHPSDDAGVRQQVELAWSPDGKNWHRIAEGAPLIPNSPGVRPPEFGRMPYDWGVIFPSTPIIENDRILLYYGAGDWYFFDWRIGCLALATLRPDGWAGYEPATQDSPAVITTNPLHCHGERLCVSADVKQGGSIRVELLTKDGQQLTGSTPIANSLTDGEVMWLDDSGWASREGGEIRLRFTLVDAKLYSFSFQ